MKKITNFLRVSQMKKYTSLLFSALTPNFRLTRGFCSNFKDSSRGSSLTMTTEQNEKYTQEEVEAKYGNVEGVTKGDTSHYIIQFTCKVCEYRTQKVFTKKAYHHGIVLIKCKGCEKHHLIADNLGWFEDEKTTVEDILTRKGEEYKKLNLQGLFQLEGVKQNDK